jgi:hypothetical protein
MNQKVVESLCPLHYATTGFHTFAKPNASKSFTLAVASSVMPKALG